MTDNLSETSKWKLADEIFKLIRENYKDMDRGHVQKQIDIAYEYMSEYEKTELRKLGFIIND